MDLYIVKSTNTATDYFTARIAFKFTFFRYAPLPIGNLHNPVKVHKVYSLVILITLSHHCTACPPQVETSNRKPLV